MIIDNSLKRFRERSPEKEIQPEMRYQSIKKKSTSLPKLQKMHFKGVEEFGNNLKSMQQNELELASLVNRLQTITGPAKVNPLQLSMKTLK